uniref:MATH domain-containing protein n=1 Tax=Panagrellus redivivus TaxID=6233 RepID=A0A7E4UUS7_PANRE
MSSDDANPPREATISVLRDSGNKVTVMIQVPGLQRRRNIFKAIWHFFSKPSNPFRLSSNGFFSNYALTNATLDFSIDVYENKQALKEHSEVRQTYFVKIEQFPSRINPESAEFELVEADSGNCYFLLTAIKLDNLNTNWKEFQADHGTLDASKV